MVGELAAIAANAVVPDQIIPYVAAVSGLETSVINGCAFHRGGGHGVLVAYPWQDPFDQEASEEAVRAALALPGLEKLTVIGRERPQCAPPTATSERDAWWYLDLPRKTPDAKLANMLRRAGRELTMSREKWEAGHERLVAEFCERKQLAPAMAALFGQLGQYVNACPAATLFAARRADGSLAAFAIGDFSALATAFYMFAFRAGDAPPGAADLVLAVLLDEAESRGFGRVNLGLGIDPGIGFFKRKWGAVAALPFVETTWTPTRKAKSWFGRLFGAGSR